MDEAARQLTVIGSFSLAGPLPGAISPLRTTNLPLADLVSHSFPVGDAANTLWRGGATDTLKIQIAPCLKEVLP